MRTLKEFIYKNRIKNTLHEIEQQMEKSRELIKTINERTLPIKPTGNADDAKLYKRALFLHSTSMELLARSRKSTEEAALKAAAGHLNGAMEKIKELEGLEVKSREIKEE